MCKFENLNHTIMRNTVAKRLMRKAEELTIGADLVETKLMYRALKRQYKKKKWPATYAAPSQKPERLSNLNSRQRRRDALKA